MPAERPRILVIRGGAIGDFILTLPVLAALRARFPQARLTVLGYPHIAQLALAGGLADEVRPIEARGLAAFFNARAEPPADLAAFFADCVVILSYLYDPDRIFEENVRRCTRATFIAGPHRPDEARARHATEVFLEPLSRLAIFDADPVPCLRLQGPAVGPSPGRRLLAAHPGSGSERKNWPEARWADLFRRLLEVPERRFLLVGGEAEGARLQHLAAAAPPSRRQVCQSLPLAQLARRLQSCRGFVGHDSGITHLAAAVGLPVVALWADTSEAVWRPQGERVRLIRWPKGLRALPVEEVQQAVEAMLAEHTGQEHARTATPG